MFTSLTKHETKVAGSQKIHTNSAQNLVNDFLVPPRSQSFSGIEKKQVDRNKIAEQELQKRSTLSLDQSAVLLQSQGTWKGKGSMNRKTDLRKTSKRDDDSSTSSNAIQRTKTFSKYLTNSKRTTQVKKHIFQKNKTTNSGIVSAQNEFLVGFNSECTVDEKTCITEKEDFQNSVFLAKVSNKI